jgi:hypothetical protein
VQGSDGFVGIGEATPIGTLHITTQAAGIITPSTAADDLIIENSFAGMTFASSNVGLGRINFADTDNTAAGFISYNHADDSVVFGVDTIDRLRIQSGESVFNEPGGDVDFRVESDTNTHALFVQGSDGAVGINKSNPVYPLDVAGEGRLEDAGVVLRLNDTGGALGGAITSKVEFEASGTDHGFVGFNTASGGTMALRNERGSLYIQADASNLHTSSVIGLNVDAISRLELGSSEAVFNESGNDYDFRVESDTNTHALFVQGSDGYVGINESAPSGVLHINNPDTPNGVAASYPVNGDEFIIEGANNTGMTILGGNIAGAHIYLGNQAGSSATIKYDNAVDELRLSADTATDPNTQLKIKQGIQIGAPTGGYKGTGTINATAVYDDNTLLTDFVLDQAVDGEIDFDFYDSLELGGKAAREWDSRNLDIDYYEAQWRERKALPSFRSKAERFDSEGQEMRDSVGTLIQGLQQELETAMVHIAQLNARIKQLEEK